MDDKIFPGLDFESQVQFNHKLPMGMAGHITQRVFERMGVNLSEVCSHKRTRRSVEARQVAMYILTLKTKASLKSIGSYFGGRDHSTVIYAKDTVSDLMQTNKHFKETVLELLAELSDDTVEA